jgi:hypothetical protein
MILDKTLHRYVYFFSEDPMTSISKSLEKVGISTGLTPKVYLAMIGNASLSTFNIETAIRNRVNYEIR